VSSPSYLKARWVVIPPFRHDTAWQAALATAVAEAGLTLHNFETASSDAPINDPQAVILTVDACQPLAAGVPAEALAGLLTGPGLHLEGDEAPDALPVHIATFSDLIGRIGLLPADRVFRAADFASGSVEVLSGVKLQRPNLAPVAPPLSPRLQAVSEAFALLDPARPQATWAPELFNYDSRTIPGGSPGQLDLTGRLRFMITGPYITLPPGRWRATYRLIFDKPGSRLRFRIDWGSQSDFVSEEFTPGRPGVFEIVQDYVWTERAPCELRVIVLEGVFDGRMTFSGAEIKRVG